MNKRKRDMWTDRATREMLSIIKDKQIMNLMDSKSKRNKIIVESIVTELRRKGVIKNVGQIRNKFKSLKSDFFKAKRNNNTSEAKRQTMEHFDLLDEICGHSEIILQADGVDVIEMDVKDIEIDDNTLTTDDLDEQYNDEERDVKYIEHEELLSDIDEPNQPKEEKENSIIATQEDEPSAVASTASKDKLRSFKRTKKQNYQKVVETFSNDWKESQWELLDAMKEQDEKLLDMQTKRYDEILQKNMKAMEKMLEKDRQETAKMLQGFINAMQQPMQPTMSYMYQPPPSLFVEPSSSNATLVPVPKLSPQDSEGIFP